MKLKRERQIHIVFLLTSLCCMNIKTRAQTDYTLQQCIDKALQNSLQVKVDTYDLERTKASVQQAYSSLLPTISGSASYQYSFQVSTSILPAEAFGGPAGTYQALKFGVPQTKSASLSLSQTLFNASSLIALKAAKAVVNLNELQIQSSKEDLVYNVSATYYNIQSIVKQIELSNQSLGNTEALLNATQDQLKAGLATQTDADRLMVSRDNSKANIEGLENSKEKYYNLLKTLMNVALSETMAVLPFIEDETGLSLLQEPAFDPKLKTNYLQAIQNKNIAMLQRKNILGGYLPTLSLTGNYGASGSYTNADPSKSINDRWYPTSSFGISLKVPIFDGFSIKYQARQKELEIIKYETQAEQYNQQNNKDVADAFTDLKSNFITYQIQQRNLTLAQKVMKDIDSQYKNGLVKVSDFLNSNTDLQTAQNNYVAALINIKQAELNLRKAQGKLINQ